MIHTTARRIVFTGCGTESDNMALKGTALALRHRGNHLITSRVEHPAILKTCEFLERQGFHVTYLEVDDCGMVQPETLAAAITEKTILVSIMYANNIVGTVMPIPRLAAIAHERGVLFHTDAVQAAGKIPVDVTAADVDLASFSAHKIHGPKGVGALYVRKGVELEPLLHGGDQEHHLRAGTDNVPGIVGMGAAAELARQRLDDAVRIRDLRDRLAEGLRQIVPAAKVNGHPEQRLPNTLNVTLPGFRGESIVVHMSRKGIALSSGSACKAGSPEPASALLAMGLTAEEAHCTLRFSLGHETTAEDIDYTLAALRNVVTEAKNTVRFVPCR